MNRCELCQSRRAVYNVLSPLCCGSRKVALCPACFQRGINEGEIAWIGPEPVGICSECVEVA